MLEKSLLLFLLERGRLRLRRLRLGHALLELIDPAGRIDKLLRPGVEGMSDVADADQDDRLDRPRFDHIAAGATDFCVQVLWMYISFHNKTRSGYQRRAA